MSYANLTGTSIRRAAVRGAQLDGITARRNTEKLLAQLPDTVPGLSASAVLCVRELSVHVKSRTRYMHSGGSVLGAELERLARNAARPALGPVSPNAEAVVFADKAEMLSCLARDYVRHLLLQGWWWRVLLPGPSLAAAALKLWVEEAAHVPVALARLARTRDAADFVRRLGDVEANAAVFVMVRAHGLALLAAGTAATPFTQSPSELISPLLPNSHHVDALTVQSKMGREIRDALPEAWAPGLSMPQRRLLALSLSLVRVPGMVRSTAFAQVLPVLLAQANLLNALVGNEVREFAPGKNIQASPLSSSLQLAGESVIVPSPAAGRGAGRGLAVTGAQDTFQISKVQADDVDIPVQKQPLSSSLPPAGERFIVPSPAGGRWLGRGMEKPGDINKLDTGQAKNLFADEKMSTLGKSVAKRADLVQIKNKSPDKYAPEVSASPLLGKTQVIESAYGGVFFLCNAALALNLYADFTRPLDRGLELSFWDFLALAAVDIGGPAVRCDPLWLLLAELAGRKPGKRLGAGFVPPEVWRMPADWLLPFAGDAADWRWEADTIRLRVLHSAGFVVLDVLRNEMSAEGQLQLELAHYEAPALTQSSVAQRKQITSFARWRGWLMPYLGHRVARALGDTHWHRACKKLMNLHGRIECDAERLAVHFSLEQLPVAVRIAGLDRDPGWIPAAGRDVRFYFGCDDA